MTNTRTAATVPANAAAIRDALYAAVDNSEDYTSTEFVVAHEFRPVTVTVYAGTHRLPSVHFDGHGTGWSKRNGARTTYAEVTCACRLTGEPTAIEDGHAETWISYGSEGWTERLIAATFAHAANALANPYVVRPAGGERGRRNDRHRVNEIGLRDEMQRRGLRYSELVEHVADVKAGHVVTAEDGTRFEILTSERVLRDAEIRRAEHAARKASSS